MGLIPYKIIKNEKQLDKLITYCKETGYASVDFETDGRPFHNPMSYPTILGVSFQCGSGWALPLNHFDSPFRDKAKGGDGTWEKKLKKFGKEIIQNYDITKIAWNLKFEFKWFLRFGIEMRGRLFDGMLAKYLLLEERPMDLKSNVAIFIPERQGYEDYPGSKLPWDEKPLQGLCEYCVLDCDSTLKLMLTFEPQLIKNKFYSLFRNMLMMGTRVLAQSEFDGFPINRAYLEELIITYKINIEISLNALNSNKYIKKFNKWLVKDRTKKLIAKVEQEIEDIKLEKKNLKKNFKKEKHTSLKRKIEVKINSKQRAIDNREDKIDRLLLGEYTNNKEREMAEPVNFASPAQMIDLLFNSKKGFNFDVVSYTIDKKTKKETERPSTAEDVLLVLQEKDNTGFVKRLLAHRGLTKLFSTYVQGIHDKLSVNDRIHAGFLLHGTVTGRLSSRGPNLQNIPRDTTASDIKPMFIPPPGMVLMQLDYSQAELRVMAAQAGEDNMIHWFKIGRDIHLAVACDVNSWDYDWAKDIMDNNHDHKQYIEIKVQRKKAKTINFGIIYGQTAKKLSIGLGGTIKEAETYLREYNERFPKVAAFIKKQHKFVKKHGFVRNIFGRKRRLPNIHHSDWGKSAEAQRQSVNAPIQGAASDYTLFSSILIWEKIRTGELPNNIIQAYTVHDSLGYFIYPEDLHKVIPIMDEVCKNPETMEWFNFQIDDVVMAVDFEVSEKNWGSLEDYHTKTDYCQLVEMNTII